jgi:hypothetical protein
MGVLTQHVTACSPFALSPPPRGAHGYLSGCQAALEGLCLTNESSLRHETASLADLVRQPPIMGTWVVYFMNLRPPMRSTKLALSSRPAQVVSYDRFQSFLHLTPSAPLESQARLLLDQHAFPIDPCSRAAGACAE